MQSRDKFFVALLGFRAALAGGRAAQGGIDVVAAGRELNADGIESLRSRLIACARRGNFNYVIDLSKIKSVDSSGLGMLVSALRAIRDLGGSVGLVTPSPQLQRILELCARDLGCSIFGRTSDAMAALTTATRPKTAA
jgi:anti-sigma B factor antagonist